VYDILLLQYGKQKRQMPVLSDGVFEDMFLASRILEDIF